MNKRVYFLMVISFVVGMAELIISGILDLIAEDLHVSLGQVGLLITIFSFILAIVGPVLLIMTSKVERKKLTLIFLYIFFLGNIVTVLSPSYSILFLGRIILATSGSLLIILCLVMAPNIVEPQYRGRAIGIISMGVSGSLVLGVPIGLVLGNSFGWRAPFVMIAILTVLSIIGVHIFMGRVQPRQAASIQKQLASLKNIKTNLALLTTLLYMAGHTVLYTYFKPYVQLTTGLSGIWISVFYFIFGIAAVSGGGFGGVLADKFGSKRTIFMSLVIFSFVLFILPFTTSLMPLFLVILIIWGTLSWAVSPAMQSYLIETSPDTADVQQSLNNSALHLGIALGSIIGGIVVERLSIEQTPMVGGIFIVLSLITILISIKSPAQQSSKIKHHHI